MIMNYNNWFYNYHKYFTGNRDGKVSFNDTKWITMNERYKKLVDMSSELLSQQPYAVMGNNRGFDKLLDLMARSNYTFEDINESLINTYKMSLQNAMSKNLVNTHCVVSRCTNNDINVTSDRFSHYWIIDVPFNQFNFGDRDEFVRQRLHEIHTNENDKYLDMSRLMKDDINNILGFTLFCTVNGYISNDCKVAIDDKGFKFKVGWGYSSDVEFIIYKLDKSNLISREINVKSLYRESIISYDSLNINKDSFINQRCIINIYDKRFAKSSSSAPNFGIFTDKGLEIRNIQNKTISTLENQLTNVVNIDIYTIKYFHEIPNVFPAVNYYEIMDSQYVYDERYENISDVNGNLVISSNTQNINNLEKCTPPITLDRDVHYSFNVICACVGMYDYMIKFENDFKKVGNDLLESELTYDRFVRIDKPILERLYSQFMGLYKSYQQGAILTSLVSSNDLSTFSTFINNIYKLKNVNNYEDIQKYSFDELYGSNYINTVKNITAPFHNNSLSNFSDMTPTGNNYFENDNCTRFNRPISEQCFISLKYDHDEKCWLFTYPDIKHFKGIGNTFYIDSDLKGDEIFKFFVLYSDNDNVVEKNIEHFDINTVIDFDEFCNEVDKHIGCIRYWDAENRLCKLSKMMYNKYDDETCVYILSKILKNKLKQESIIDIYPSEMNYEMSNMTSDNWEYYDENTERSPFAINFMFYTLTMLNDNEDKLQSYFYHALTNRLYNIRYSDIMLNDVLEKHEFPVNYTQITVSPNMLSDNYTIPLSSNIAVYYGLPLISNKDGSLLYDPYRYVFNVYNNDIKLPMIIENNISQDYYVKYDNPNDYGSYVISYNDIAKLIQHLTRYLCSVYDCIGEIQTSYKKSYNMTSVIDSYIESINTIINDIKTFINGKTFSDDINNVINLISDNNVFINRINTIHKDCRFIREIHFNDLDMSTVGFINKLIGLLHDVYITTGFDNYIMKRTRMLYINLKRINSTMNPYEYMDWLMNLDIDLLSKLDDMLALNENYTYENGVFKYYHDTMVIYINKMKEAIKQLHDRVDSLNDDVKDIHIKPIVELCDNAMNKYVFDMFIIDKISYDKSVKYTNKPEYIILNINDINYINIPVIDDKEYSTTNLVFQPIIEKENDIYLINMISNICEYVFFNGDTIENVNMNIIDKDNNVISTQNVSVSFVKVSSSIDRVNTFNKLPAMLTTKIDFENIHESFEVVNDIVVNEKHADMNYEMLINNHFVQLDHETELVLQPNTWLQGSIDRIYIENSFINRLCLSDLSHRRCHDMFFKPTQVFHIVKNDDNSIDSVNGKYFEGQTIYLMTEDKLFSFPVIVTKVDHSINKGFIECKVDDWNTKWFKITDKEMITKYLNENIVCSVIDDNISNFLDEFSDSSYMSYSNAVYNNQYNNINELPGDPLFVSINSDIVYNRLNYFFNELISNRFIDEEHKTHKFIYIGNGFINNENDIIKIHTINHNMNTLTNPEMYPILRAEPNDHMVWDEEIRVFKSKQFQSYQELQSLNRRRQMAEAELAHATTQNEKNNAIDKIEQIDRNIGRLNKFIDRMELCIRQLETPTTWYNVNSYDASLVYIANGRADNFSPNIISNIRDILYTDKLEVFLYDWEHKQWLSPSSYAIETEMIDSIKIDECDDYSTNRVLYSITIKPKENFIFSKKILVYFSYNKSDIYDDIQMNENKCYVRFKPFLSIDNEINNYDPYSDIRIRKHFDGFEKYKIDDVVNGNVHIKRIKRNGKYTYSPTFRLCDITFTDTNGNHDYTDIDKFYIKSPFNDVSTNREFCKLKYDTEVNVDIDNFIEDIDIKLICISNNKYSSYDGNISDIMFTAKTSIVDNKQHLTIINSTLPNFIDNGSYVCTVFRDNMYPTYGGVITINITSEKQTILDNEWILIPNDLNIYRELPMEFMFTIKNPIEKDNIIVTLKNNYLKNVNDDITPDNSNLNNPYEYYYDYINCLRLPISDVRINSHNKRFVIDKTKNTNISVTKTSYIGICRYSVQKIPKNGFIDLTGYVNTPISHNRYEFWINGRCITNKNDIIILSPSSIQLCNMKSLKNFEVIELVDDVSDNELLNKGNVYVDINGNTYSTYKLAMLSNSRINHQDIMFTFNTNNHKKINDYTKSIISNPNNQDIEEDILNTITFDESNNDYNKLFNIPSINGITVFHPSLSDLGITEIPSKEILRLFDNTWKLESLTNPLFNMTHIISNDNGLILISKQITEEHWNGLNIDTKGMFSINIKGLTESFFSLYISKSSTGKIDDINNTVKIIPFISAGTSILLNKEYEGMWLHSTYPNTKPIKIMNY